MTSKGSEVTPSNDVPFEYWVTRIGLSDVITDAAVRICSKSCPRFRVATVVPLTFTVVPLVLAR